MSVFNASRPGFGYEKQGEGETNDWMTPPELVRMLGHFDLDPCGCRAQKKWLADKTYLLPEQDGLLLPWNGRVFCNPPYGKEIGKWAERMRLHKNGIFLIFSRTETEAWKQIWQGCTAVLMPYGRISFIRADGQKSKSGTAPSALVAYGDSSAESLKTCQIAGAYCEPKWVGKFKASGL